MMTVGEVVADVEEAQVQAGQLELIAMARKAPFAESVQRTAAEGSMFNAPASALGGSSGIPVLGGAPIAIKSRPKIEVLSEACESCSA